VVSIVIPAHNEERVLGRLLGQLVASKGTEGTNQFDVVVVANGCTDHTATVAASFGPPVRVITIPVASKQQALAAGNRAARGFPRLYVDADVELRAKDAQALAEALDRPGVLAAGPEPTYAMVGRSWPVRWYYDVWTRLPEVRRGLFGRGVVGVSAVGYLRIANLPPLLADDLAASLAFSTEERAIVPGARVVVHPPRTFGDLLRGRARAAMGVNQVEQAECALASTARTRFADLAAIARRNPHLVPRIALFLTVALLARSNAHRVTAKGGYSKWLRDDSSRDNPASDSAPTDMHASHA
jgi:hypothetical protein